MKNANRIETLLNIPREELAEKVNKTLMEIEKDAMTLENIQYFPCSAPMHCLPAYYDVIIRWSTIILMPPLESSAKRLNKT